MEHSLVKKADLKCRVELEKQETMLILTFDIAGTINANCDRCLAQYPQQVDIHEQAIVKFNEEAVDEDEEIIDQITPNLPLTIFSLTNFHS